MVAWIAKHVCHRPGRTVLVWIAVTVTFAALAPSPERVAEVEPTAFLPDDEPYRIALAVEHDAFPEIAARSRTVIVFERETGLTPLDHAHIADVARRLVTQHDTFGPGRSRGLTPSARTGRRSPWRVLSPGGQPFLRSRLVSQDGCAAMIVVSSDTNWVTSAGRMEAEEIARIAGVIPQPNGLNVEITGQGGLGRDLGSAGERALRRTTRITVVVVLLILLLVYRAPLAALVPLLSIGLAVFVTLRVLDILSLAGWSIGTMEKTFAVVLIYGSGTDFAMFWIARYRELLDEGRERSPAAVAATVAVAPAIIASAGTTIAGLLMLILAGFLPSSNAGRVLALALSVSLVSALTLIPAVAQLMGRWLFWPTATVRTSAPSRRWRWIANLVLRRPVLMLTAPLALLCWPVVAGMGLTYRYDGLGVAPENSSSARGQALAERHFSAAQLFSWSCLIETSTPLANPRAQIEASGRMADALAETEGVADVWDIAHPLGRHARTRIPQALLRAQARSHYVSPDNRHMRFEVLQQAAPFSNAAMRSYAQAMSAARAAAGDALGPGAAVRANGMTPNIVNIKNVTDHDHERVTLSVAGVILVILIVWTRRLFLPVFMLATTLLVYYATLGLSDFVFREWLGVAGIDWKVRLILFVIVVAVGQDFNIFLVSQILQERRVRDAAAATWRGLVQTGPVISSCGMIMAATFATLIAAGLDLYRQLGFAFAAGVLLFTFVIRPLVIPSGYLVLDSLAPKKIDSGGDLA